MIKKYVKRPIPIQAIQFTGDNGVWIQENFCPKFKGTLTMWQDPDKQTMGIIQKEFKCWIETMQGNMAVKIGDYVVKGVRGQFYCCDKDIFEQTYQQVKQNLTRLVRPDENQQPEIMTFICQVGPGVIVQGKFDSLLYAIKDFKPNLYKQDVYIATPHIPKVVLARMNDIIQLQKQAFQLHFEKKGFAVRDYAQYLGVNTAIKSYKDLTQDLQVFLPLESQMQMKRALRDHYIHIRMFELGFDMDNLDQYEINLDDYEIGYTKQSIQSYLQNKLELIK